MSTPRTALGLMAVGLTALLSACNPRPAADATAAASIYSARPLYRSSASASDPALRNGLWLLARPECTVDEAASSGAWPACAEWMVVRPQTLIIRHGGWPAGELDLETYVLGPGLPRVLQTGESPSSDSGNFRYAGLRALSADVQGRIVRFKTWGACPDPPTDASIDASDSPSASQPCKVTSQGEVRSAIIRSERGAGDARTFHWVRDEEH